jgi:carbon-monoxide dehydrogenase medium subunit
MSVPQHLHRPVAVEEVLELLRGRDGVRCLAGGATLVAMMNAGLAEPTELVSLAAIPELRGISVGADGAPRIGAMTRHAETAADPRLEGDIAVVREAAQRIANPPVRNMGTMGGSIAFADPAADYPPALVAAGAEIEVAGDKGRRRIAARDFFTDWYTTALQPHDIVVAVHLRPPSPGFGLYDKLARVAGDFATVSVALSVARNGRACSRVGLAVGGCGPKPVRLDEADDMLCRAGLGETESMRVGEMLADAADPVDDVRASADYRRLAIRRMVPRLLARARMGLEMAA